MTPSELANKIAEEVFRTIERDRAIIKAEIVDAVEKVLAQEAGRTASPVSPDKPGEWRQLPPPMSALNAEAERWPHWVCPRRRSARPVGSVTTVAAANAIAAGWAVGFPFQG